MILLWVCGTFIILPALKRSRFLPITRERISIRRSRFSRVPADRWVCIGGDDDGGTGTTSVYTFTSTASFAPVDYFIYVDGHGTNTGNYELSLANMPLPVRLVSFEGEKMEKGNQLTWVTASEENTEYFSIERSVDGVHWSSIVRQNANGFFQCGKSLPIYG